MTKLLIRHADVVTPKETQRQTDVFVDDGKIKEISPSFQGKADQTIDAEGCFLFPGFIDMHVHGGMSANVADSSIKSLDKICRFHGNHGTTTMMLTTSTLPDERIKKIVGTVQNFFYA